MEEGSPSKSLKIECLSTLRMGERPDQDWVERKSSEIPKSNPVAESARQLMNQQQLVF